ncbi:unnamed protein product [Hymenolepis diminuta]|uniref:Uncharacterized protein n=2 Tax=Hymenolepis diminuta TaxID=6216 RepID=A0A564YQR9_HYMDI|nr:unnamed protein product [Hymenolepis diminuta]
MKNQLDECQRRKKNHTKNSSEPAGKTDKSSESDIGMTEDGRNIIKRFSSVFKYSLSRRTKNLKERIEHLPERITLCGFHLRQEKCKISMEYIKYLHFIVHSASRHPNAERFRAIVGMPSPINIQTLRSFLPLIGYYNCFPPFLYAVC